MYLHGLSELVDSPSQTALLIVEKLNDGFFGTFTDDTGSNNKWDKVLKRRVSQVQQFLLLALDFVKVIKEIWSVHQSLSEQVVELLGVWERLALVGKEVPNVP